MKWIFSLQDFQFLDEKEMLTDVKRGDFTERWSRQTLNISPTTNLLRQDYKSGYCSHQNYIKRRLKKK